jgi:hypothetical protein
MRKIAIAICIITIISCKNNTTNLSNDSAIKPNQFIAAFKPLENNFFATDTNIFELADTVSINHNLLSRFVPDTLVNRLTFGDKKTIFHAIGRISKTTETYIVFLTIKNKKPLVSVLVFDKENNFLAEKDLLSPHTDAQGYKYNLSINKEPTFYISREKYVNDKEVKFTKVGWAFNGKTFAAVVKETNERDEKLDEVINPIDTLPILNKYSGTYVQDDKNYIAIRDGKNKLEYHFFLHIDKNEGTCIGELKGSMQMVDSTNAIYNFAGDPCIIDFIFDRNIITIKEQGSCGNRRGMDCFFDDAYTKRKEAKKKEIKAPITTNATQITAPMNITKPTKIPVAKKAVTPIKSTITKPKTAIKLVEKPVIKTPVKSSVTTPKTTIKPVENIETTLPKKSSITTPKPATKTPVKPAEKPTPKPAEENPYAN